MTNKKGGINAVVAGVTGAVVGAGIGVGAAMLSNEKNRKKAIKVFNEVRQDAADYVKGLENAAVKGKVVVEKKLAKGVKKARTTLKSGK